MTSKTRLTVILLLVATAFFAAKPLAAQRADTPSERPDAERAERIAASQNRLRYVRRTDPARLVVTEPSGRWLATFTEGARTVTLAGPKRVFLEPASVARVESATYVRLLPEPFDGTVEEDWLRRTLEDRNPDVLQIAMQYLRGARTERDREGRKIAGGADYGPLQKDGTREEGSDFNDYLGIPWKYGDHVDRPEKRQAGSLDCSGFVRMVYGYRCGVPLTLRPDGKALPRRAFEMLDSAPGVTVIPDRGKQVTDFGRLAPGDLLFFDADPGDGNQMDHVGIYLGVDTDGHHRFFSSRKSANGPALGDYRGKSILDGTGLYARSFRAARRL